MTLIMAVAYGGVTTAATQQRCMGAVNYYSLLIIIDVFHSILVMFVDDN